MHVTSIKSKSTSLVRPVEVRSKCGLLGLRPPRTGGLIVETLVDGVVNAEVHRSIIHGPIPWRTSTEFRSVVPMHVVHHDGGPLGHFAGDSCSHVVLRNGGILLLSGAMIENHHRFSWLQEVVGSYCRLVCTFSVHYKIFIEIK
jgi:hypothetical protein